MKRIKSIKSIVLIFVCLLLISGCVKSNTTMTINDDKSMVFEVETMISEEANDYGSNVVDINNLEKLGFKVTTITENGYKGYRVTKTFNNIDDLSNNDGQDIFISDIFNDGFDTSKLFKLEKSFLKDTYTANFKFKVNEEYYYSSEIDESEDLIEENTEEVQLTFIVNLPSSSISNNANLQENGNKTLTWTLSSKETSFINYSFEMYNKKNLIILGGSVFGALILFIVLLIVIIKKKSSKKTLIYKDYDQNIAPEVEPSMKVEDFIKEDAVVEEKDIKEVVKGLPKVEEKKEEPIIDLDKELITNKATNLEFELPKEEIKQEQIVEETKNLFIPNEVQNINTQNTNIQNNNTFNVVPPSVDYHNRPDFVNDDTPKTFILNEEKPKEVKVVKQDVVLDVPDGIALSDMGNIKK